MPKKTKKEDALEKNHELLVLIAVLNILILFAVLIFGGLMIMQSANTENSRETTMIMKETKPSMHASWDVDGDGINDCEKEGTCDHTVNYSLPKPITTPSGTPYNQDSWKNLIADSCQTFTDGCNTCTRTPGSELAACTKKACFNYERPRCLDEERE